MGLPIISLIQVSMVMLLWSTTYIYVTYDMYGPCQAEVSTAMYDKTLTATHEHVHSAYTYLPSVQYLIVCLVNFNFICYIFIYTLISNRTWSFSKLCGSTGLMVDQRQIP
jgi:hypothetical protein